MRRERQWEVLDKRIEEWRVFVLRFESFGESTIEIHVIMVINTLKWKGKW